MQLVARRQTLSMAEGVGLAREKVEGEKEVVKLVVHTMQADDLTTVVPSFGLRAAQYISLCQLCPGKSVVCVVGSMLKGNHFGDSLVNM